MNFIIIFAGDSHRQPLDSVSGVENGIQKSSCINFMYLRIAIYVAMHTFFVYLLQSLYVVIANSYVAIPVNILHDQ